MARPLRVPSVLSLLSAILVASPARADLRPGDIVMNEPTIYGEVLKLDPVTRAVRHVTAGGYLPSYQSRMALDAGGNLIVVAENKILRVDPSTGAQTLVSSGGMLQSARGLAIAPDGGLIVSNLHGSPIDVPTIVRVDPLTGAQALITSGGSSRSPRGLILDAQGSILVTSTANGTTPGAILRVDPASGAQTVAFSGGLIQSPSDLSYDLNGQLYVVDTSAGPGGCSTEACGEILRVDPATGQQTLVSSGGQLTNPQAIEIAFDGALLVTDYYVFNSLGPRLLRIDPVTGVQSVFSSRFSSVADVLVVPGAPVSPPPRCGDDRVNQPTELCDGEDRGVCPGACGTDCTCFAGIVPGDPILADPILAAIVRIDPMTGDRTILSSNRVGSGPPFGFPRGLGVRRDGKIFVADGKTGSILRIDPWTGDRTVVSSSSLDFRGLPIYQPVDLAVDSEGRVLVVDNRWHALMRVDEGTGDRVVLSSQQVGSGPLIASFVSMAVDLADRVLVPLYQYPYAALIRIDPVTGNRSVVTGYNGGQPVGSGLPLNLPAAASVNRDGSILVLDSDFFGQTSALLRVDAVTGDRTLLSGCQDFFARPCPVLGQGVHFFYPLGVTGESGGSILVADDFQDLLFRVDAATGDRTIVSSANVGRGPELLGPFDLERVPTDLDSDSDGILDDGDTSSTVGDHACSPGQTAGCDDNCRLNANPGQNDFDADSQGDACDADDDNDGLADAVETSTGVFLSASDTGTSPINADSDGDGFTDGAEVAAGSDPNDPASLPQGGAIPTLGTTGVFVFVLALLVAGGRALRRDRAVRSERGRA